MTGGVSSEFDWEAGKKVRQATSGVASDKRKMNRRSGALQSTGRQAMFRNRVNGRNRVIGTKR